VSEERFKLLKKTQEDLGLCKDVLKSIVLHHSKWKSLSNVPNSRNSVSKR
jgi:hypothetical protein